MGNLTNKKITVSDESGIIKLASIDCVLNLDDIYDKVEVSPT
jgi:hypothetical protein